MLQEYLIVKLMFSGPVSPCAACAMFQYPKYVPIPKKSIWSNP